MAAVGNVFAISVNFEYPQNCSIMKKTDDIVHHWTLIELSSVNI